jgi:hypothetical protein
MESVMLVLVIVQTVVMLLPLIRGKKVKRK